MRIQSTHSPIVSSRRLVVSLSDGGDTICNETICFGSDENIISDRFVVPNSPVQSFDVCVVNARWSVMLVTTPTTIQYCWYLTSRGNETDSRKFHSIAHAFDGCDVPSDWSCVKWVPLAARFIVMHGEGCFCTNTISAENEALQLGSKKMAVSSEIGSQNKLMHRDESMVVGLHLMHANSSEALLVMQNKHTGLHSIQYADLRLDDNAIHLLWGLCASSAGGLCASTANDLTPDVPTAESATEILGSLDVGCVCFDGSVWVVHRGGVLGKIVLQDLIGPISSLLITRVVPSGQLSVMLSCYGGRFHQLDIAIDAASNSCRVTGLGPKLLLGYNAAAAQCVGRHSGISRNYRPRRCGLLFPHCEVMIALPVELLSRSDAVRCSSAFIGYHPRFGVQVMMERLRDGCSAADRRLLQKLSCVPQVNRIFGIQQVISLEPSASSVVGHARYLPQRVLALCCDESYRDGGAGPCSVLHRLVSSTDRVVLLQDVLVDAVAHVEDTTALACTLREEGGASESQWLMLGSNASQQSSLFKIERINDGLCDFAINSKNLGCCIQDESTIALLQASDPGPLVQVTRTRICVFSPDTSTGHTHVINSLYRGVSNMHSIDSHGEVRAIEVDSALADDFEAEHVAMAGWGLFLISGRRLLLLQLTPTGAQSPSLVVVAKGVFVVPGPISSASSAILSSTSNALFLSYWDARCDSQLFRVSIPVGTMHFLMACSAPGTDVAGCHSAVRSSCLVPVHSSSSSSSSLSIVGLICSSADGRVSMYGLSMQQQGLEIPGSSDAAYSLSALASFRLHDGIRKVTLCSSNAMRGAIVEGAGSEHYLVGFHMEEQQLRWRCTALNTDAGVVSLPRAMMFLGAVDARSSDSQLIILGWLESRRDATTHLCFGEVLHQSMQQTGGCGSSVDRIVFGGVLRSVQLLMGARHSNPTVLTLLDATKVPARDRLVAGLPRIIEGAIALFDVHSFDCLWQQSISCAVGDQQAFLTILAGLRMPPMHRTVEDQDGPLSFSWIHVDKGRKGHCKPSIIVHSTIISFGIEVTDTASLQSAGLCSIEFLADKGGCMGGDGDGTADATEQAVITDADRQAEIDEQQKQVDSRAVGRRHLHARMVSADCLVLITPEAPTSSIVLIGWEVEPSSSTLRLLEFERVSVAASDGAAVIDAAVVLESRLVLSVSFCGLLIYTFVPATAINRRPSLELVYCIGSSESIYADVHLWQQSSEATDGEEDPGSTLTALYVDRTRMKCRSASIVIPSNMRALRGQQPAVRFEVVGQWSCLSPDSTVLHSPTPYPSAPVLWTTDGQLSCFVLP